MRHSSLKLVMLSAAIVAVAWMGRAFSSDETAGTKRGPAIAPANGRAYAISVKGLKKAPPKTIEPEEETDASERMEDVPEAEGDAKKIEDSDQGGKSPEKEDGGERCAARIVGISGACEVRLASKGKSDWAPAELNQCLQEKDEVRTLEEGMAALGFEEEGVEEQTIVSVNAGTTLSIGLE